MITRSMLTLLTMRYLAKNSQPECLPPTAVHCNMHCIALHALQQNIKRSHYPTITLSSDSVEAVVQQHDY